MARKQDTRVGQTADDYRPRYISYGDDGLARVAINDLADVVNLPAAQIRDDLDALFELLPDGMCIEVHADRRGQWLLTRWQVALLVGWYAGSRPDVAGRCKAVCRYIDAQQLTIWPAFAIAFADCAARAKAKPKPPTFVYFAQDGEDGLIKIGITKDVQKRVNGLSNGSGRQMRLLHSYPGGREEELDVHALFDDLRVQGEWFRPGDALLAHIKGLAESRAVASNEAGADG